MGNDHHSTPAGSNGPDLPLHEEHSHRFLDWRHSEPPSPNTGFNFAELCGGYLDRAEGVNFHFHLRPFEILSACAAVDAQIRTKYGWQTGVTPHTQTIQSVIRKEQTHGSVLRNRHYPVEDGAYDHCAFRDTEYPSISDTVDPFYGT